MNRIRISDIDQAAKDRPATYRDELMSLATLKTSEYIEIKPEHYNALWEKYRIVKKSVTDPSSLSSFFDRVVVINLDRRADRMVALSKELERVRWPFAAPTRFRAVDASKVPQHDGWTAGSGGWGCMQSHRQVLQEAMMDGVNHLLVLEDDVVFADNFADKIFEFLLKIPDDWEQLMIGGQFQSRYGRKAIKQPVASGVLRVGGCERTHAYAVRAGGLRDLYSKWCGAVGHCDHVMGPWQHDHRVYAPDPFLAGQGAGKSDISGSNNATQFWIPPPSNAPVFWIKAPLEVVEAVRGQGLHGGRMRSDGVDLGLKDIVTSPTSLDGRVIFLKRWISMIQWEGRSMSPPCFCFIYCPDAPADLIEEAAGKSLQVIETDSAQTILDIVRRAASKIVLSKPSP